MDKRLAGIEPEELPPLQILPLGRTAEQEEKLASRKAFGRFGKSLWIAYAIALALILAYAAGYGQARTEVTSAPPCPH